MTYELSLEYWQAITVIEAQEALMQLQIADFPHVKKGARQRLHTQLKKMATVRDDTIGEGVTPSDMNRRLRALINGRK